MPEQVFPSTQYGDLIGSVQFDGHSGPPLSDLADLTDMPQDYCPVAIKISLPNTLESVVPFSVFAYEYSQVGYTQDEIRAYIAHHGELPLREFECSFPFSMFDGYFKQGSILTYHKSNNQFINQMRVYSDKEWEEKHKQTTDKQYPH